MGRWRRDRADTWMWPLGLSSLGPLAGGTELASEVPPGRPGSGVVICHSSHHWLRAAARGQSHYLAGLSEVARSGSYRVRSLYRGRLLSTEQEAGLMTSARFLLRLFKKKDLCSNQIWKMTVSPFSDSLNIFLLNKTLRSPIVKKEKPHLFNFI